MTEKETRYHTLYMDIAKRFSQMSQCTRLQVGSILVKEGRIISTGWNGQPTGFDNKCEDINNTTLPTVNHSEVNLLTKLARSNESSKDSVLYITHSPCLSCAKLITLCDISEVYYGEEYRTNEGIEYLKSFNIKIQQYK